LLVPGIHAVRSGLMQDGFASMGLDGLRYRIYEIQPLIPRHGVMAGTSPAMTHDKFGLFRLSLEG
jgi:hypothetical protein